jgi:RimJ/RimL family protein N-acetyltransferase
MEPLVLSTRRLELVLATAPPTRAAAEGDVSRLGRLLVADVPADWPPDLVSDALPHVADALEREVPPDGVGMYFILLRTPRTLIGTGGLYRSPNPDDVVVGYSIVASQQRRGYATEATQRLVEHALALPSTRRVLAETLPDLTPSIRVLEKLGFVQYEKDVKAYSGEENAVRYELRRPLDGSKA